MTFDLTEEQCEAVFKAVSMANITRDVKTPEKMRRIILKALGSVQPPTVNEVRERTYSLANHFDSMRNGLPEDWQDFAVEVSNELRSIVVDLTAMAPQAEAEVPVAWRVQLQSGQVGYRLSDELVEANIGFVATPTTEHPDDAAVDEFAARLKAKLGKGRAKGRGGWDGPDCNAGRLSTMLREHVAKGDPVDVAAFCMFLTLRGEGITPIAPTSGVDEAKLRETLQWVEDEIDTHVDVQEDDEGQPDSEWLKHFMRLRRLLTSTLNNHSEAGDGDDNS